MMVSEPTGRGVYVVDFSFDLVNSEWIVFSVDSVQPEGMYGGIGTNLVFVVRAEARTDGYRHEQKTRNNR
mgnify:CR=1 FL=1